VSAAAVATPTPTAATHTAATRAGSTHRECALFSSGPVHGVAPGSGNAQAAAPRQPRVSARAAFQEVLHGRAVLVDARPAALRAVEGDVAAALRPVALEPAAVVHAAPALVGARVVVLCHDGAASPEAVDVLVRLGVRRATDVVGGFRAWRAAGLPTS
jgi:rhodanese-related sulfurtransferase